MGTFPKTLGFWSPFKTAAAMAFLWLADCCLCCAGSLMCLGAGLWKGICSRYCVFEGVSGSGSLLPARSVSPFVWCISSPSGVVSCHNSRWYLAAFPPIQPPLRPPPPPPFFFRFNHRELFEHKFISAHAHDLKKQSYEGGRFIVGISRDSRQTQGLVFHALSKETHQKVQLLPWRHVTQNSAEPDASSEVIRGCTL